MKSINDSGHRLTVYLPKPLYRRLQTEAKKRKSTLGKVVRERLEKNPLTAWDVMSDLAGSVSSGKGDLSCNPNYFKNFGK